MAKKQIIKKKRSIWAPLTVTLLGATTIVSTGLAVYFALRQGKSATYTVTVNLDQDEYIYGGETQKMLQGSLIGQIPTPYKDASTNLIFDHWQEAVTNTDLDPQQPIDHNMTIKAVYKQAVDAVAVTLNMDGGNLPGSTVTSPITLLVKDDSCIGELPTPVKSSYIFQDWQDKDKTKTYSFEAPVTNGMQLYAHYKVAEGNYLDGGSRVLQFKTYDQDNDTAAWSIYDPSDPQHTPISADSWTITDESENDIQGVSIADGIVKWDGSTTEMTAGRYTAIITATKGEIKAWTKIGIVIENPVYTVEGDTNIIINENDDPVVHQYKVLRDTHEFTGRSFNWIPFEGTIPPGLEFSQENATLTPIKGKIQPGVYQFRLNAFSPQRPTISVNSPLITFICNSKDCTVTTAPTGPITIYNDENAGAKLSTREFKLSYNGSEVATSDKISWDIDQASKDAGIEIKKDSGEYYLYAGAKGVTAGSYDVTVTGTYTLGDTDPSVPSVVKTASTTIKVVSNAHTYKLANGTQYSESTVGWGGTAATAWNVQQDKTTTLPSGYTVAWSVEGMEAALASKITVPGGLLTWANDVPSGKYNLTIKATVSSPIADVPQVVASMPVTLNIVDHTYTITGGSTMLKGKTAAGGHDDESWKIIQDAGTVKQTQITTGITWDITLADGSAAPTGVSVPEGKVTWTDETPDGQYDLLVKATYNTKEYTTNVSLIISEYVYVLSGGSRGFTVKPSETKTDTNTWKLTKDTAEVTTPNLSITDITPSITGVTDPITIADGKVTVKTIPEGTYTFNVAATDNGKIVTKQQVSLISTETYSIKYGNGTIGSSLTIKDNATAVDSNAFTLLDSGSTTQTGVTWVLDKSSTTLTDAQLHWDTTDTNKLSYANVPTGTYNLTISAKMNDEVKATIPFTLTSQDTKIALQITGADTIKTGDGLTSAYDTNLTDKSRVSWEIDDWSPTVAGATEPELTTSSGVCTVTVVNQLHPEGTLTLKATDSISGQSVTKAITITKPYAESTKVFTYDTTNQWCTVPMTDLAGTGTITKTTLGGTALTAIARTTFNDAIYIGDKVSSISNNFLDGCTAFNSEITFDTTSECLIIGNDFLSGCTAFNQSFTIPASVQMIGDSFFNNCQAFNTAITIPATVTKVGNDFMYNCYAMTATITINTTAMAFEATGDKPLTLACDDNSKACYATGMTIAGADVANFKLLFPNITATTAGVVCRNIL